MAISKTYIGYKDGSAAGATLTTDAFDSTGYTHAIIHARWQTSDSADCTPSDNKSSINWQRLPKQQNASNATWTRICWVKIGSPGTGHTITCTFAAGTEEKKIIVWLVNSGTGEISCIHNLTNYGTLGGAGTADGGDLLNPDGLSVVAFLGTNSWGGPTAWNAGSGWTQDADTVIFGESRGPETTTTIAAEAEALDGGAWSMNAAIFAEYTLPRILHPTTNRQLSR